MLDEKRLSEVVAEEANVGAAYLFGSHARGTARATSDVDVALVFRDGVDAEQRFASRTRSFAALGAHAEKTGA